MIEFINVNSKYENKTVLNNINLTIEKGKITVIIGPNGCGKTTLLKTLVRIHPHCSGEIKINHQSIENMKTKEIAQNISYLAQNRKAPDMTVFKMILHGRFPYLGYPRKYRNIDIEMANQALKWTQLDEYKDEYVNQLSGGLQQRTYIAMALAQDSDTILMDEPTTYLDIAQQLQFYEMIRKLADSQKAIVIVLHDLNQALQIADKIIVLNEGNIVGQGSPEEIYKSNIIQNVFHVEVNRYKTDKCWQYYCTL